MRITLGKRGSYRVTDTIGTGAFSTVFKGIWDGQDVAIKKIDPNAKSYTNKVHFITNEIEIHKELKHDHIVEWIAGAKTKSFLYLILEYMPSGSLYDLLYRRREDLLDLTQQLNIIKAISSALNYIHQHYLHRDIKPENILFDGLYRAKLADFGLAMRLSNNGSNEAVGTPDYLARELAEAFVARTSVYHYTTKTDVWALGITFLEMIRRAPPLHLYTNQTSIYRIRRIADGERDAIPTKTDEQLRLIILGCLTTNPKLRFDTQDILNLLVSSTEPKNSSVLYTQNPLHALPGEDISLLKSKEDDTVGNRSTESKEDGNHSPHTSSQRISNSSQSAIIQETPPGARDDVQAVTDNDEVPNGVADKNEMDASNNIMSSCESKQTNSTHSFWNLSVNKSKKGNTKNSLDTDAVSTETASRWSCCVIN
ncbi:MAG: serine/threonine-protein kinase [Legionellaceae bacterium]|nr:serine/threonine-protein kinase [Legionellaceae bacterium]